MSEQQKPEKSKRGKLSIPASFDDALRAALKVKPPEKPKRKPRARRPNKQG